MSHHHNLDFAKSQERKDAVQSAAEADLQTHLVLVNIESCCLLLHKDVRDKDRVVGDIAAT